MPIRDKKRRIVIAANVKVAGLSVSNATALNTVAKKKKAEAIVINTKTRINKMFIKRAIIVLMGLYPVYRFTQNAIIYIHQVFSLGETLQDK